MSLIQHSRKGNICIKRVSASNHSSPISAFLFSLFNKVYMQISCSRCYVIIICAKIMPAEAIHMPPCSIQILQPLASCVKYQYFHIKKQYQYMYLYPLDILLYCIHCNTRSRPCSAASAIVFSFHLYPYLQRSFNFSII